MEARPWLSYLLVAIVGLGIFFPGLGSFGLWDPWETHYGEVTRNMIESRNWIDTRWGYGCCEPSPMWVGERPAETGPFMSKPILIFWSEAISVKFFGYSEWAFRFPMAFLAFMLMMVSFHVVRRITSDWKTGFMASLVVASCPQFYLISRQAQTDMPFVGTMSIGVLFFLMAVFRGRSQISDRRFYWTIGGILAFLAVIIFPQIACLSADVDGGPKIFGGNFFLIDLVVILLSLGTATFFVSVLWPIIKKARSGEALDQTYKDQWVRRGHLYLFYTFIGLATLAKGLLGFLLPGALIFLYILISRSWRLLAKVELLRGIPLFFFVSLPWYVGMFFENGISFYQRFFVHDHFKRFGAGVHQVDTGLFEHFIKWLGVGMFPWAVLVPVMLIPIFTMRRLPTSKEGRLTVFLFIWTFFAYALFTKSSTKFHHYVFPALPPLAFLIGIWLRKAGDLKPKIIRLAAIVGIGFTLSIGFTIDHDKQTLRNLMTYKYDRPLPKNLPVDPYAPVSDKVQTTWEESRFFQETPGLIKSALTNKWGYHPNVVRFVMLLVITGLMLWLIRSTPAFILTGIGFMGLGAVMMAVWALNVYMPMLSPAWSQRYIFEEYYQRCDRVETHPEIASEYEPFLSKIGLGFIPEWTGARIKRKCKQDIVAWLFTWRGETFYGSNDILPISKRKHLKDYLMDFNGGETFYAVLEDHRKSSFKTELKKYSDALAKEGKVPFDKIKKWETRLLHAESPFFVLMIAEPVFEENKQAEVQP